MKFLGSYYTICSENNKKLSSMVCFADVLRNFDPTIKHTFNIAIIKDNIYGIKYNKNHNCLVSKEEILKLIKSLKGIYKFSYKLSNCKFNGENAYKLTITLDPCKRSTALFILTVLRYTYEFPYNVILKEAFCLSRISDFRFYNIIGLCNLIHSTIFYDYGNEIHGLLEYNSTSNKTKKEITNSLVNSSRVHDVFSSKRMSVHPIIKERTTLEYWNDIPAFIKRMDFYKQNLKSFNEK